jgi:TPR repeat protein
MTRTPVVLIMLLCTIATFSTACKHVKTVDPAIAASLVDGWNIRPHGVKLSRFMAACDAGYKTACNEAAWLMETSSQVADRAGSKALLASHGTCDYDRSAFYSCVHEGRLEPSKQACERGQGTMCRLWGKTLQTHLKREIPVALEAYKRGCDLGDGVSCRLAASIYEYDKSLPSEEERPLRERACELGEHTECWMLAQWHARGSHGYTRDHDQYKVLMAESARLEAASEARWTVVRRSIQQDALNRLEQARTRWANTLNTEGPAYCIQHSTPNKSWVIGTIEAGQAIDWRGCQWTNKEKECVSKRGPAPTPMKAMFDACEQVLQASPERFEYGLITRPDGALLSCYVHAEGYPELGQSVSTSKADFGTCR